MKKALLTTLIAALFTGAAIAASVGNNSRGLDSRLASSNQREQRQGLRITPVDKYHYGPIADQVELAAKDAYWHGDYARAAELYHLLIRLGRSTTDGLYNLACCYGQLGNSKQAAKYLGLSVESGFEDMDHIRNDPDFEKIKNTPNFRKVLDRVEIEISKKKQKDEGNEPAYTANATAVPEPRQ